MSLFENTRVTFLSNDRHMSNFFRSFHRVLAADKDYLKCVASIKDFQMTKEVLDACNYFKRGLTDADLCGFHMNQGNFSLNYVANIKKIDCYLGNSFIFEEIKRGYDSLKRLECEDVDDIKTANLTFLNYS